MFSTFMTRVVFATVCSTALALVACSGDMHGKDEMAAGHSTLRAGMGEARTGIQQIQAGDTVSGTQAVAHGRDMMGKGMTMMGGGCCLTDGGTADSGMMDGCAAMMGEGMNMMMQGLARFDGGHGMMTSPDAATAKQAMADMEAGMGMMEKGADHMMNGGMGSMGSMHGR